jgi:hypothetical protein
MNFDHTFSPNRSGGLPAAPVPELASDAAPPPPPPPPPPVAQARREADFAATAAMAKDILELGIDEEEGAPPQPTREAPHAPQIPDFAERSEVVESHGGLPMAADFFTSSRPTAKKRLWRIAK